MVIRDVISKTVGRPIDSVNDDTDLFKLGQDSLQSSRIRDTLQLEADISRAMVIRDVISKTVGRPIDSVNDDTDLFKLGQDSLQSSRIRDTLQRLVYLGSKKLSPNTGFEDPSIAQYVHPLMCMTDEGAQAQRSPLDTMLELVNTCSSSAHTQKAHVNRTNGTASNPVTSRVVSPLPYFPIFNF
jgi:acyl carrier protein